MQRSHEHASGTVERGGGHMCSGNRCIRNDKSGRNPSWSRSESWVAQRPHMLQWQAGVRDRHAGGRSDEGKKNWGEATPIFVLCMTSLPQKKNLGLKQQAQGTEFDILSQKRLRHRRAACTPARLSELQPPAAAVHSSVQQIIPEMRAGGCILHDRHQALAATTAASALPALQSARI